MIKYMTQKEFDDMWDTVLDEELGITVMDLWEYEHPETKIVITDGNRYWPKRWGIKEAE